MKPVTHSKYWDYLTTFGHNEFISSSGFFNKSDISFWYKELERIPDTW
jgi:hypothetical protein